MERIRNISELPDELRVLAEANRSSGRRGSHNESDDISSAFIWSDSPEGDAFWYHIYNGRDRDVPLPGFSRNRYIQDDDQIVM